MSKGEAGSREAQTYRRELPKQYEKQAATIAALTGWDVDKIRGKMNLRASSREAAKGDPWWKQIWTD